MLARLPFLGVAAVLVCTCPVMARAQTEPEPKRILLLYSPPPDAEPIAAFTHNLRVTVRDSLGPSVEFYEEHLDLDRFPGRERWPQLARYYREKYGGLRIDAVVPVGSVALRFVAERLSVVLPDVPVVYALTPELLPDTTTAPLQITGRRIVLPFAGSAVLARRLQPDANRIVVVGGISERDSVAVKIAVRDLAPLRDSMEVVVFQGLPYDSLLTILRRQPSRTIVLLAYFRYYRREQRGLSFVTSDILSEISRESSAPVYGIMGGWVGVGMVGGDVIAFDDEGVRVGQLLLRVLGRAFGDPMPPPEVAASTRVVDWRQLQRWGLSERRLPPGTRVLFRSPTIWERYRAAILIALAVMAAQAVLIALLLLERRRRRLAQVEVEDQAAYERMIAELRTDAVRYVHGDSPGALEDALARVGRYAGAGALVLVQDADGPAPRRLTWVGPPGSAAGNGGSRVVPAGFEMDTTPMEIPLVTDGVRIGALEVYRAGRPFAWPARLAQRLDLACDILANAMAHSRAAEVIRRGEDLNRAVLASLSSPIAILDQEGTIVRVNDAWREVARNAGVPAERDAFVGENYLDECRRAEERDCEEAKQVRWGVEAVLRGDFSPFRCEYVIASAEPRWYEMSVERLHRADGGAIVTHLDISDRRRAERRAEETRRQVAHMGRVAMVGELAAAVTHELRQPLAAIRSNAQAGVRLLAKETPDVHEASAILREIVADDVRASDVIDHIRLLLRKEEATTTAVNLNEVCQLAGHFLAREAGFRGVRLDVSLDARTPSVLGDAVQLQQVVLNLALNALDAAAESTAERRVLIGTEDRTDEVELFVQDTGPGLPPEVRSRLFESFFSTKSDGLGLGLVIVRSIVERHGGRIRAENHQAGGAIFRVILPLAVTAASTRWPSSRQSSAAGRP